PALSEIAFVFSERQALRVRTGEGNRRRACREGIPLLLPLCPSPRALPAVRPLALSAPARRPRAARASLRYAAQPHPPTRPRPPGMAAGAAIPRGRPLRAGREDRAGVRQSNSWRLWATSCASPLLPCLLVREGGARGSGRGAAKHLAQARR